MENVTSPKLVQPAGGVTVTFVLCASSTSIFGGAPFAQVASSGATVAGSGVVGAGVVVAGAAVAGPMPPAAQVSLVPVFILSCSVNVGAPYGATALPVPALAHLKDSEHVYCPHAYELLRSM